MDGLPSEVQAPISDPTWTYTLPNVVDFEGNPATSYQINADLATAATFLQYDEVQSLSFITDFDQE